MVTSVGLLFHALTVDSVMAVIFFIVALYIGFLLYQFHNGNNGFSVVDLLMENGKASTTRFSFMVALVVSTWAFVELTLSGKLSEWYFTGYMVSWVAAKLGSQYLNKE